MSDLGIKMNGNKKRKIVDLLVGRDIKVFCKSQNFQIYNIYMKVYFYMLPVWVSDRFLFA